MPMETIPFIIFCSLISLSVLELSTAADTLTPYQSITNGESLVSSGQTFELGFFSPNGSKNLYLGIWYKISPQIVVWVANRENPITDSYGNLTINSDGNLVLINATKGVIWSSNSSTSVQNSSVAQLLNSGNLILKEKSTTQSDTESSYIWQSFDFPSDTLLPGMKLGWNLKTGQNKYLTSWRDDTDPSPGDFTFGVNMTGMPQLVVQKGSSEKIYNSGPWNGVRFSGVGVRSNPVSKPSFIADADEVYFTYESINDSYVTRLTLNQLGMLQRLILNEGSSEWAVMYTTPNDPCDEYGHCGGNGICRVNNRPVCECLDGFITKSQEEWDLLNWSSGCVRRTSLDCQKGEGFQKLKNVKLPDLLKFLLKESLNLKECESDCLKNCSCIAYSNGGSSGCLMWFGDLVDIRDFEDIDGDQDIYIRMPASELKHNQKEKTLVLIVVISTASGMVVVLSLLTWCIIKKRRNKIGVETKNEGIELPFFDLVTIANATKNFSSTSMIGEGGFGPVFKGMLTTGQEIAVKRLSNNSGQGLQEFTNEVILISKLQHRNLVRLLGCCTEGDERMLIYEYMPNKSLDYFIFELNRRLQLPWEKRFEIAMGISRGLLYLHQDSRLRIIHRDLKASNILLDDELSPKISDFGIARSFGRDQIEAKTKRVIGTYGYMAPEYAIDGKYSEKSDVFSFGVLLLEIVSGMKNWKFHHPDHYHSLLGHAWLLWNKHKPLELVDACLENSYIESQVVRCINVALLCVQKLLEDRPSMSSVVSMLGNEGVTLPQPRQPGFFIERSSIVTAASTGERCHTENALTMTIMDAR